MGIFSAEAGAIPVAARGVAIQRVLVDGWSAARAAAACGASERQVNRWVAHYRRDGMASLRDTAPADTAPLQWLRRLRLLVAGASPDRSGQAGDPVPFVAPPRAGQQQKGRLRRS